MRCLTRACSTPVGLRPGGLPVVLDQVLEVHAGCVLAARRSPQNKPLDSYHECDLNELRARWERAIDVRKQHVDRELRHTDLKVERQTCGKTAGVSATCPLHLPILYFEYMFCSVLVLVQYSNVHCTSK